MFISDSNYELLKKRASTLMETREFKLWLVHNQKHAKDFKSKAAYEKYALTSFLSLDYNQAFPKTKKK